MSHARDQIYSFVNRMAQFAMHNPNGLDYSSYQAVKAGSGCYEDLELRSLLDQVADDRAHAEAERLRKKADEFAASSSDLVARAMAATARGAAIMIDPYEERDGQLVRRSDGKPVII